MTSLWLMYMATTELRVTKMNNTNWIGYTFEIDDSPISAFDLEARKFPKDLKVPCKDKDAYFKCDGWGIFNISLQAWLYFPNDKKQKFGAAIPWEIKNGRTAKLVAGSGLESGTHWVIL